MRRPWLCVFLLAIAFATAANGQSSLATIWSYTGQNPNASMVVFLLYGTTLYLGTANLGSAFTLVP